MKYLFLIVCFVAKTLFAQETTTIQGRIISEDFEVLPGVKIFNKDTVLLGLSDIDGYFKIEATNKQSELLLNFIAMEWTSIKVQENCQNLEMFVMLYVIYDWMPRNKINRKRRKRFKRLPNKHLEAYEKGIFTSTAPCVSYIYNDQ